MRVKVKDMVRKVRVALDEMAGTDVDSDFQAGLSVEIESALLTAATELSEELPDHLLMPITKTEKLTASEWANSPEEHYNYTEGGVTTTYFKGHTPNVDGTGTFRIPSDFLRLVRFRLEGWPQDVRELTDPASNIARMQACDWSKGTPQKPILLLAEGEISEGYRLVKYYTAAKTNNVYNHIIWRFSYLPMPSIVIDETEEPYTKFLEVALQDRATPLIVYRACAIVMEGKQNNALADRFRAMSVYQAQ